MVDENVRGEFRLKNIDETINHFVKEIEPNELMNKKYKKVCMVLSYNEHFLILASAFTRCISFSVFAFFVGFPIVIAKRQDKTVLPEKIELNSIKVLIKALIDSNISHDEFVIINNGLKSVII